MHYSITALSDALVRVLGHSLWQGAIVGVLVWGVLRLLPAKRSDLRYGVAVGGLVAVVLMCFATWSVLRIETVPVGNSASASAAAFDRKINEGVESQSVAMLARAWDELASDPHSGERGYAMRTDGQVIAYWLSALWLCGAVVMLVRGMLGFVAVRAWLGESANGLQFDVSALEAIVKALSNRLGLRRVVRVFVSDRISVPAVIGTLWPVILVPPAMLSGVPVEQWQIIIAHELAHVWRWDAVVSLAQMVIESLLFFNPAVWWLSRQVRVEREACCDALAAKVCGQPLSVARVLVEVASVATQQSHIAAALAFAEPTREGELTDRVRRLVDPDQAPRSKVSWVFLGAVFVALAATAVLLQRGTDLAVRAAAEWMSPKERIEKLVELEAERNGNIVPLAEGSQGKSGDNFPSPSDSPPADPNAGKIAVFLIVKTDDGSDVSPKLSLTSVSAVSHSSSANSLNTPREAVPEHRLTLHYPPCHLRFIASQPGRAIVTSPVISLMPTDREKTIELILTKGLPVDVVVRNEQGQPIPHAWVQQSTPLKLRSSISWSGGAELQADEHGRLRFEHIGNIEHSFLAMAPGYQRLQFENAFRDPTPFTPDAPLFITLKAARPTPVRVIDAVTNQPIKNAQLRLAHRQSKTYGAGFGVSRRWLTPNKWSDYGVTDEAGRASLDQLEEGAKYSFAVFADGYGTGVLETKPGQLEQTVKLSQPLKIAGRVTGSIERLQKQTDPKKTGYQFSVYSRLSEHINDNMWAEVDAEGRFTLEGYSVGEQLTLSLPDERRDIELKTSVTDLEFDIKPAAGPTSYPKREVVIRLTGTAQDAPARGSLYVSWQHPTIRAEQIQNGPLPVRGNEIRFNALVGAHLNFREEDLVGYRITEQNQIEIKAGSEPQIIEVPAVAAGGIHGSITRADGSPAQSAFVYAFATKLPSSEKDHGRINPSSYSGGSQFLRKVPLGGRYVVLAREQTPTGYVWAISNEVTIDESHPIAQADIKLPTGRDLQVKVLDDTGKPVVGQEVQLEIGFRQRKPVDTGFSSSIASETDSLGFAKFQNLAVDQPLGPVELTLYCTVKPNPFRGSTTKIDPSKPIELRLTRGVSASGVVIDSATNKPIPDAEVRIHPRHFDQASFKQSVTAKTDADGRFRIEGLEPIEYSGYVEHTSPKGTIVTPYGNSGLRFSYPAEVEQHSLTAGPKEKPVRWEVIIHPGSKLRPAE